jgi:leucyl/phenylalanyl-tRNA--protein transferase
VGGLYGVALGKSFCGESMFAESPDASKLATVALLGNLCHWGFHFVDCQVRTEHLARFGAQDWPRSRFLAALRVAVAEPLEREPWKFALDLAQSIDALDAAARKRDPT